MKDLLREILSPADDGRAFRDAVLMRAAGALHRRRSAAEAALEPPWMWLAAWARPWLIAAIIGLSFALALPGWARRPAAAIPPTVELTADVMGATTSTAYVLAETIGR